MVVNGGGAMLLVTESAPSNRRGYYGAYAQAGAPMGVILANIAFISVSLLTTEESFLTWGWRIPFIISFVLVIISMYIQLKLEDTKAFKELEAAKESDEDGSKVIKTSPILEALKRYPKRISLAAGAFLSVQVTFYILVAFVLAYGVETTDLSRNDLLTAVLIGSAIMVPTQFFFSDYSDKKGRKGIFMAGALLTAIWAFFLFPLIDSGNFFLVILGVTGGLTFLGMMYGPQAAFFAELFTTEVRYSGASLGYQIGAIIGGSFAPTIATLLWTSYDIFWVSVYIATASIASLVSVYFLTETYKTNLNE